MSDKNKQICNFINSDYHCFFCAQNHIQIAINLYKQSIKNNRQKIIGQLILAKWHLTLIDEELSNQCNCILNSMICHKEAGILENLNLLLKKIYPLSQKEILNNKSIIFDQKKIDKIYIFSNVSYPYENKLKVKENDLLVFLNTASSIDYYKDHFKKMVFHRSVKQQYGQIRDCPNMYVFDEQDKYVSNFKKTMYKVSCEFVNELKKTYDWNYQGIKDKPKGMTTGYMVVKLMQKQYPNKKIILVNFGYQIKNSTYRCLYHNWEFENESLQQFEHIYTAETIKKEGNVYIICSVSSKKINASKEDMIILLNKDSIQQYKDHKLKIFYHRNKVNSQFIKDCINMYIYNDQDYKKKKFIERLKSNYPCNDKLMSDSYVLAMYLNHLYTNKNIILVDFDYDKNGDFEREELKNYKKIKTIGE